MKTSEGWKFSSSAPGAWETPGVALGLGWMMGGGNDK